MTDQPHPVLVGIDGTASGLEAIDLAGALSVLTGSPLLLAAVYGFDGQGWPPRSDAERWLAEAAQRVGDQLPWSTAAVASSSAGHGLAMLATREHAGLIVLGSSHHGPIGRVLAGSTVRSLANGAECPVAVVPHGWRIRPTDAPLTFGAGVTRGAESREALVLAAALAAAGHASLRVLTVVELPSPAHPMFAATSTSYTGWCRDRRRDAERSACETAAAVASGVPTEILVLDGRPLSRLTDASHDLDLLVVGSRRYGPLRRVLLGGVSTPLIDCAACPVVIVPRGVHPEPRPQGAAGGVVHA